MVVRWGNADLNIGAKGFGDLLANEILQRLAGDASDDFTDQMPVVHGVIAGRGPGWPPWRLTREMARRLLPVVHLFDVERELPARNPRSVGHQMSDFDVLLAVFAEFRPVLRDGREGIQQAAVDQDQR